MRPVHVYRIQHPDPQLFYSDANAHVFPMFMNALQNQNAAEFVGMLKKSGKQVYRYLLQGGESQFQVLKKILNNKDALIFENSDPEDIQETLRYMGSHIRDAFPKLQLPEKFSQLTELQRVILMVSPLHYIVSAINLSKPLCPTMLGSQQEIEAFMTQSKTLMKNVNNNQLIEIEMMQQMNIMHALSVCLATKSGMNTDLVTGALHDTNDLRCFIGSSYTEFFYPSKKDLIKQGYTIPEDKYLSPEQCKKNIISFLEKFPSYQRFISFCFNNITEAEAHIIKDEYKATCYSTKNVEEISSKPVASTQQTSTQNTEATFATQMVSSTYNSFTTAISDEYAKSFNSLPKQWMVWLVLQFFFSLASELVGEFFNNKDFDGRIIEKAVTTLFLLSVVRVGIEIFSKSSDMIIRNMPNPVGNILKPIVDVSAKLALPLYSGYSSGWAATLAGLFSGHCGRKGVQYFVPPENEDGVKLKAM